MKPIDEKLLKVKCAMLQTLCEEMQFEIYEKSQTRKNVFLDLPTFWEALGIKNTETMWIPLGHTVKTELVTLKFYGIQGYNERLRHIVVDIEKTNKYDNTSIN